MRLLDPTSSIAEMFAGDSFAEVKLPIETASGYKERDYPQLYLTISNGVTATPATELTRDA